MGSWQTLGRERYGAMNGDCMHSNGWWSEKEDAVIGSGGMIPHHRFPLFEKSPDDSLRCAVLFWMDMRRLIESSQAT